jgi:hypothetical protein
MAFEELDQLHREVMGLSLARADREWSADEFNSYLELARRERVALRRYRVLRGRFDNERRRASRMQAAGDREHRSPAGPAEAD